jgi:hypothetical protein
MDAAAFLEDFGPRTKQQMIRVGQNQVRAGRFQALDRLPFDRRLGSDRAKDRSSNFARKSLECRCTRL